MALNQLGLGFLFSAKDLVSGTMDKIYDKFVDLEGKSSAVTLSVQGHLRNAAMGFTVMGGGLATLGILKVTADAAGDLEQALAAAGAIAGATGNELRVLEQAAMAAGVATQFSPVEAAQGLKDLAAAGFSVKESIDLLRPTLDLAAGSLGELSPQAAAGLAAQAIKAFGLEVGDAGLAVDQMLQGVNVFALGAGELPMALGTASRGAQALNQSLSETMIALGLVKDIIPGVERASTAVAVSMERMADPKVQQKLKGIGVAVANSEGKFRNFLDIVGDMSPKLNAMSEAQRSAFLMAAFGNEALGGLNAILTQVKNGVRSSSGEMLKGADAISYLRNQFDNAGGTAGKFRDTMLGGYNGAKLALANTAKTWAIAIGEPIKDALKPAIAGMVEFGREALKAFQKIPKPILDFAAKAAALGAALASVLGLMVALKSAASVAAIGMRLLGVSASTAAAAFGPVLLLVGAAAAAMYVFKTAYERNIGGFGDFVRGAVAKVSLAFRALGQLLTDGAFSGDVLDELGKNTGVENFAINAFVWIERIKEWWRGLGDGFETTIAKARPAFTELMTALKGLAYEFGFVSKSVNPLINGGEFDQAGASGQRFGAAVGRVVVALVKLTTNLVKLSTIVAPFISKMASVTNGFLTAETAAFALSAVLSYKVAVGLVTTGQKMVEFGSATISVAKALASTGPKMWEFGAAAVDVARAVWKTVPALYAMASANIASGVASIVKGFTAISASATASLAPLLAYVAAFAAWYVAYQQYKELSAAWDDNSGSQVWSYAKNKWGITSDEEYEQETMKRQGVVTGADYQKAQMDRAWDARMKGSPTGTGPMPAAAAAAGQADMANGSGNANAAAMKAVADAANRVQTPQTMVSATMMLDGQVLGEVVANAMAGDANRAGVPVGVVPR